MWEDCKYLDDEMDNFRDPGGASMLCVPDIANIRREDEREKITNIVSLARLSKFFGFLRFSSPRAVKTPPGAPEGPPKP